MNLDYEGMLSIHRKNLDYFRQRRESIERIITTTMININDLKRWQYEESKNGKVNIQDENENL